MYPVLCLMIISLNRLAQTMYNVGAVEGVRCYPLIGTVLPILAHVSVLLHLVRIYLLFR